jgi:putative salt-induced outer membrane protein YdiY
MQNTPVALFALLITSIPLSGAAQTPERLAVVPGGPAAAVQASPAPPPPPPPPRHERTAEFAFVGTTGNAEAQTLGVGGEYIFRPAAWVIRDKAAFVRNESEGVLTVEQFGNVFRGDRALSPRAAVFGEYTYFRDRFAGIDHRNQVLGGVSYKIVNLPAQQFFVDGGLGYTSEQRSVGGDISTGTYATGVGYRWKISPTADFADDLRVTGGFDAGEDWRIVQMASLTARITTLFSLKLSNTIRYNNMPVPGFEDTDTTTSVALVAKF